MDDYKFDIILKRLDDIDKKLAILQNGTETLENHIKVVEHIASVVNRPIQRLLNIDVGNYFSIESSKDVI